MALIHVDFFSEVLGLSSQMDVILPQKMQGIGVEGASSKEEYPVLWLLHGASDDHTIWQRRTSIERYAAPLGIAVVMPAVQLSSYTNMVYGGRYFDYITEELPQIVKDFFPISNKREDNFVAGLSMGGYGAMKVGLAKPDKYSAIGCFSAGNTVYSDLFSGERNLDNESEGFRAFIKSIQRRNKLVFGTENLSELKGSEHDLFALADKALEEGKSLPAIFHACGTEDFLLDNARATKEWFGKKPIDYTYNEGPGGHTWEFWDEWIQKYLNWMTEKKILRKGI